MTDTVYDIVPATPTIADYEARVNVTFGGLNGDLTDAISTDSTDAAIRTMVAEALQSGSVRGIPAQANPDLSNFMVDRFGPTEARPWNLLQVRPKVAYGG